MAPRSEADIKVTDGAWVPSYAAEVHKIIERHGGRYLSRSGNIRTLEGSPRDSTLIALVVFPSMDAIERFAADPDYKPYGKARQTGSVSHFVVIDDTDVAGAIPYLVAGKM
ncbi:DUF1330 domain-containing protein [Falsiroseomonas sp. E2-1-a20]|uniref:DUF1330 domain-containing protein n=1 Tax=Falsiroseomonas sp. E2-1-a20 TaxID=3239300 RepID=UPI003F349ED1